MCEPLQYISGVNMSVSALYRTGSICWGPTITVRWFLSLSVVQWTPALALLSLQIQRRSPLYVTQSEYITILHVVWFNLICLVCILGLDWCISLLTFASKIRSQVQPNFAMMQFYIFGCNILDV